MAEFDDRRRFLDADGAPIPTSRFMIEVIEVPLASPQDAAIVNRPRLMADPDTGNPHGLWEGGSHGPGTQWSAATDACHDITVYPEIGLAAAACEGNGLLLDISDPVNPVRIDEVTDPNFAYWHSATISNDGTKVVFVDEWGGGVQARCRPEDPVSWGADAIFDVVDTADGPRLQFASYYKIPGVQADNEACVAHNSSLVPVPGRDVLVQAWYEGGISVMDFTDSANPFEIAFFDRGPYHPTQFPRGGYWAAYWYDGWIYGSEIFLGFDSFALEPSPLLTANEVAAARSVRTGELNAQAQRRITWPPTFSLVLAHLDQAVRAGTLDEPTAVVVGADIHRALMSAARSAGARVDDQVVAVRLDRAAHRAGPGPLADELRELAGTSR